MNNDKNAIDFLQPKGVDNFSEFGIRFISGVNEYVDNSTSKDAKNILIAVKNNGTSIDAFIIDDGVGMDGETLKYAISFGGESAGVIPKAKTDTGKYHAGMTISSFALCNRSEIFTNNGDGWVMNYIDKEEIKKTRKVFPSKECELPKSVISILDDAKKKQGLDIQLKTGTVIILKDLNTDIIGPNNFDIEIENLYNTMCLRYHCDINKGCNIYIMVNTAEDIRECVSIDPLLENGNILKENGLEAIARFKYNNILTIKEVLPYSKEDGTMDIEFVLLRKINKYDKMLTAHKLIRMEKDNQGTYMDRNLHNIIAAKVLGYQKRHDSLNGCRSYSNLDGKWDGVLGINVNKSMCNPNSMFFELLNERLKKVHTHIRKVLRGEAKLNPPIIEIAGGRKCTAKIMVDLTSDSEQEKIEDTVSVNIIDNNPVEIKNNDGNEERNKQIPLSVDNNEINTSLRLSEKIPIIFAAKGKPNLIVNMGNGSVNLTKDNKSYYVYDKQITNLGIRKTDIEEWLQENKILKSDFYEKIKKSIRKDANCQMKFYKYYLNNIYNNSKKDFFMFPEVYINVNSKNGDLRNKQCVDFLLILPNKEKIIIEIDGIGHYSKKIGEKYYANPEQYAIDRRFDRKMKFEGYTVFRFGNEEISDENILYEFFEELFK